MTFGTAMLILGLVSIGSMTFMYFAENPVRKDQPTKKDWKPTEYQLPQNQYLQPGTMVPIVKTDELKDLNEEEDIIEKMLREARSRK